MGSGPGFSVRLNNHPAFTSTRPLLFGHRGTAALAPENTLMAFDHALALHVDGLELDVRLARDGIAVVHHDATLERTTNASGPLSVRTADELACLDAAFHFAPEQGHPLRGQGIGIPRLRDVLARYRDIPLIIELKGTNPALARAAIDEVRAAGAGGRVCLGGYSLLMLWTARAYEPQIATSAAQKEVRWALYRSRIGWPASRVKYRVYQVPEFAGRTRVVSPRFIRAAHGTGLPVQVWTVNSPADMRRFLDWGADGIITDRPDVAVPTIEEWTQQGPAPPCPYLRVDRINASI